MRLTRPGLWARTGPAPGEPPGEGSGPVMGATASHDRFDLTGRCGQHPGMDRMDVGRGVELCYELLGTIEDPVIVLVAGLGRQLIGWDDTFCGLLMAEGFSVLRFDNRDAGL